MSLQVVGTAPTLPIQVLESISNEPSKVAQSVAATNSDLRTLRHANLESNPVFSELKQKLEEYFEDRKLPSHKQKVLAFKSSHWREVLFSSLLVLLSEVTFTHEEALQQVLLSKVKKWYDEKTAPPTQLPLLIKRKEASPNLRRVTMSETPMRDRQMNIQLRKLDAIPSIESRSPSPTKTPKLPRLVFSPDSRPYADYKAVLLDEQTESKLEARYLEFREREMTEMKATCTRQRKV